MVISVSSFLPTDGSSGGQNPTFSFDLTSDSAPAVTVQLNSIVINAIIDDGTPETVYTGSTDTFAAGWSNGTSARAVIANGFSFVLSRTAGFAWSEQVAIQVIAEDDDSPANDLNAKVVSSNTEPYDLIPATLEAGFSITRTLDLELNGTPEAVTFQGNSPERNSTNNEPYTLADGNTLELLVDGTPLTITFDTADFSDITNATAQEVADAITAGGSSSVYGSKITVISPPKVYTRINSFHYGTTSTLEVTGGTALTNGINPLAYAGGVSTGGGNVADLNNVTNAEVVTRFAAAGSAITPSATATDAVQLDGPVTTDAAIQVMPSSTTEPHGFKWIFPDTIHTGFEAYYTATVQSVVRAFDFVPPKSATNVDRDTHIEFKVIEDTVGNPIDPSATVLVGINGAPATAIYTGTSFVSGWDGPGSKFDLINPLDPLQGRHFVADRTTDLNFSDSVIVIATASNLDVAEDGGIDTLIDTWPAFTILSSGSVASACYETASIPATALHTYISNWSGSDQNTYPYLNAIRNTLFLLGTNDNTSKVKSQRIIELSTLSEVYTLLTGLSDDYQNRSTIKVCNTKPLTVIYSNLNTYTNLVPKVVYELNVLGVSELGTDMLTSYILSNEPTKMISGFATAILLASLKLNP